VRPVVTVDGGGVASVCASTAELVDQFSGFTTVLLKRLLARMTFCRMSRSLLVACPTGA